MGPGKMMFSEFWIIPMAMCVIFMFVMFVTRARGGIGPHMFMNKNDQADKHRDPNSPLEILHSRYARGEINKSEYETIKREIQS